MGTYPNQTYPYPFLTHRGLCQEGGKDGGGIIPGKGESAGRLRSVQTSMALGWEGYFMRGDPIGQGSSGR